MDEVKSILIASPLHDGKVESSYLLGMLNTQQALLSAGVPHTFFFNSGESLVPRVRNNICKVFLNRRCAATGHPFTHLLMIDSDLGFNGADVCRVLGFADDDHQVIAGLAPIKSLDPRKAIEAAKAGCPPGELFRHCTRNVVNPAPGYEYKPDDRLVPVRYAGSGFMLIARQALMAFSERYPELRYKPDYRIGDKDFDDHVDAGVMAFFDTMISPDEVRYLSEDYTFCYRCRQIGIETFVARDVRLSHTGKYTFFPNPTGV